MSDEQTVLTALQAKEELFSTLEAILNTKTRKEAFIEIKPGRAQSEIADAVGVSDEAIRKTREKLMAFGLVEEAEDGWRKTLRSMDHPVLEYLWREEVLDGDG